MPTERSEREGSCFCGLDFGIFRRYVSNRAWRGQVADKLRVGTYIVVAGTVSLGGGVLGGLRRELPEAWQPAAKIEVSVESWFGFLSCAATRALLDTGTSSGP